MARLEIDDFDELEGLENIEKPEKNENIYNEAAFSADKEDIAIEEELPRQSDEDEESELLKRLSEELERKRKLDEERLKGRRKAFYLLALIIAIVLSASLAFSFMQKKSRENAEPPTESEELKQDDESYTEENAPSEEELIVEEVLSAYERLGIVRCSSYINFRSAPDQKNLANIMGMLRNGAGVDIIDENVEGAEGWALVRSGGMEGYISNSYLLKGEEAEALVSELIALRATVLADKLRIRSSPEIIDGNTLGSAAKGERYELIEEINGEWLKVRTDNLETADEAYISALAENTRLSYGLDEARSLDLRQKVLNSYDRLGVSKASDYVNIRKTKETGSINNIVGKFPGHAAANILAEEEGWYKIKSGKVTGYVKAEFIATGKEAEAIAVSNASVMAIVNTDALNVRSEPGLESNAWTKIVKDQRYNVLNQLDGWVQLELDTGDDDESEQGAYVSTRDNNVTVMYALQEAIEYYPALDAANAAMAKRSRIVNYASQFVGNPYVWGGTSLTKGADCSGFVMSVLRHFGISVPRTSRAQAVSGKKVSSKDMRPGDLVFYANKSGTVNHVAMYIGNGQVVNAASRRSGIKITRWNYRTPVAIRNVID